MIISFASQVIKTDKACLFRIVAWRKRIVNKGIEDYSNVYLNEIQIQGLAEHLKIQIIIL